MEDEDGAIALKSLHPYYVACVVVSFVSLLSCLYMIALFYSSDLLRSQPHLCPIGWLSFSDSLWACWAVWCFWPAMTGGASIDEVSHLECQAVGVSEQGEGRRGAKQRTEVYW